MTKRLSGPRPIPWFARRYGRKEEKAVVQLVLDLAIIYVEAGGKTAKDGGGFGAFVLSVYSHAQGIADLRDIARVAKLLEPKLMEINP